MKSNGFDWLDYFTGGAFYTPETIDTARLHYRNSWAPILHAVALWLNSTGFTCSESAEAAAIPGLQKRSIPVNLNQASGATPSAKSLPEINKDRMHLILGRCVVLMYFKMGHFWKCISVGRKKFLSIFLGSVDSLRVKLTWDRFTREKAYRFS